MGAEVVVQMKSRRGGARVGAGRKPGAITKDSGRIVYVIHEEAEPTICKIGIANDPLRRLRGHQVSNWRRLKLAGAFVAGSSAAAIAIESAVHKAFWGVHVSGEWFRVSPEKACAEVEAAASCTGLPVEPFNVEHLKTIKTNQDDQEPRR